jgi:oxidoreductase
VIKLGFDRVSIFRPALLLCERQESRPFEKLAQGFSRVADFGHWFSVPTKAVAKAMVVGALKPETKAVEVFSNADIIKLASS